MIGKNWDIIYLKLIKVEVDYFKTLVQMTVTGKYENKETKFF